MWQLEAELRHPLGPALNALLDKAFANPKYPRGLVDLSGVESTDSTCLGILVRIANHARKHGAPRPTLFCTSEDIIDTICAIDERNAEAKH